MQGKYKAKLGGFSHHDGEFKYNSDSLNPNHEMTDNESDLVNGAINLLTSKNLSLNEPHTLTVESIYNFLREDHSD